MCANDLCPSLTFFGKREILLPETQLQIWGLQDARLTRHDPQCIFTTRRIGSGRVDGIGNRLYPLQQLSDRNVRKDHGEIAAVVQTLNEGVQAIPVAVPQRCVLSNSSDLHRSRSPHTSPVCCPHSEPYASSHRPHRSRCPAWPPPKRHHAQRAASLRAPG